MMNGFEMIRTNTAHIGSAPLSGIGVAAPAQENAGISKSRGNFENYLLDAVNYVNGKQMASADIAQQLIIDPDSVDVHDVTIAMAEASMSLSIMQNVIDRVLTSWSEITTTR
ncbi:MAG TPA: flagellar hook-basal body complex protein FliE [Candidatus Treponema faecavium]|nr:flagellar hook-basal body complex protein FliE [Candidatus Treponema faecavium]